MVLCFVRQAAVCRFFPVERDALSSALFETQRKGLPAVRKKRVTSNRKCIESPQHRPAGQASGAAQKVLKAAFPFLLRSGFIRHDVCRLLRGKRRRLSDEAGLYRAAAHQRHSPFLPESVQLQPYRSSVLRILPLMVLGSASRNSTMRGYL